MSESLYARVHGMLQTAEDLIHDLIDYGPGGGDAVDYKSTRITQELLREDWQCERACSCKIRKILNSVRITNEDESFSNLKELSQRLGTTVGKKSNRPALPMIIDKNDNKLSDEDLTLFSDLLLVVCQAEASDDIVGVQSRIRQIARHSNVVPRALFRFKILLCFKSRWPKHISGFADVFTGTYGWIVVAIKMHRFGTDSAPEEVAENEKSMRREGLIWQRFKHKNIMPFIGLVKPFGDERIGILTPWMELGSMRKYLFEPKNIAVDPKPLLKQLADALSFVHGKHFIHGDLKAANVLMKTTDQIYLSDLGLTMTSASYAFLTSKDFNGGGTLRWLAPELVNDLDNSQAEMYRPSRETDVYSLGMTIYEAIARKNPYFKTPDRGVAIEKRNGTVPLRFFSEDGTSEPFEDDRIWELLEGCWKKNPWDRLETSKVMDKLDNIINEN